jgi:hypothetical protein
MHQTTQNGFFRSKYTGTTTAPRFLAPTGRHANNPEGILTAIARLDTGMLSSDPTIKISRLRSK